MDSQRKATSISAQSGRLSLKKKKFQRMLRAALTAKSPIVTALSHSVGEARQMVAKAAEKKVYLGCNLNHYFTPTAERARKYMDEGKIGELVYCLHKMGFSAGEDTYGPNNSSRFKGFPYAHLKAFMSHPFSCMRYFCGDVTHVQAFVNRPWTRRRSGDTEISRTMHL